MVSELIGQLIAWNIRCKNIGRVFQLVPGFTTEERNIFSSDGVNVNAPET